MERRGRTQAHQSAYALRGEEVREIFRYVAEGGPVFPLEVLTYEGAPWRRPG